MLLCQSQLDNEQASFSSYLCHLPTLGYETLLADLIWLNVVQLIGDQRNNDGKNATAIAIAVDFEKIVQLDHNFMPAYYFAVFILGGDFARPDLAKNVLEIGLRELSSDWQLPYLAGVNQFLYASNTSAAAKYYRIASSLPGAPGWLAAQSLTLESHIPDVLKEINVWDSVYGNASDKRLREIARGRLCSLWQKVYKEASSKVIKMRAESQLQNFGYTMEHP